MSLAPDRAVRVHSNGASQLADLSFRSPTPGPEKELIDHYLSAVEVKVPADMAVTFFQEPRIESGAPDLVGVVWNTRIASTWVEKRKLLRKKELRLAHYLASNGSAKVEHLRPIFRRGLSSSIDNLIEAEIVEKRGDWVVALPLSEIYAVRHIFAIEAKITFWRAALTQAFRNRWFATTSFVLLPTGGLRDRAEAEASRLGVKVLSKDDNIIDCRHYDFVSTPTSYCSWLFNEWAWRSEIAPYAQPTPAMDCYIFS